MLEFVHYLFLFDLVLRAVAGLSEIRWNVNYIELGKVGFADFEKPVY